MTNTCIPQNYSVILWNKTLRFSKTSWQIDVQNQRKSCAIYSIIRLMYVTQSEKQLFLFWVLEIEQQINDKILSFDLAKHTEKPRHNCYVCAGVFTCFHRVIVVEFVYTTHVRVAFFHSVSLYVTIKYNLLLIFSPILIQYTSECELVLKCLCLFFSSSFVIQTHTQKNVQLCSMRMNTVFSLFSVAIDAVLLVFLLNVMAISQWFSHLFCLNEREQKNRDRDTQPNRKKKRKRNKPNTHTATNNTCYEVVKR